MRLPLSRASLTVSAKRSSTRSGKPSCPSMRAPPGLAVAAAASSYAQAPGPRRGFKRRPAHSGEDLPQPQRQQDQAVLRKDVWDLFEINRPAIDAGAARPILPNSCSCRDGNNPGRSAPPISTPCSRKPGPSSPATRLKSLMLTLTVPSHGTRPGWRGISAVHGGIRPALAQHRARQPGHGGRQGDRRTVADHGGREVVDRFAVQEHGLDPVPQVPGQCRIPGQRNSSTHAPAGCLTVKP